MAAAPLVGVDETSFQRRHEYVTVVNDLTALEPRVLYVADGRDRAVLDGYFDAVGAAGCAQIEMVAMDMWPAYIGSVHDHTEAPIAFDKFRIAQHLSAAVDQVRRSENRVFRQQGDDRLAKTRYLWLTRPANLTPRQRRAFTPLRTSALRVARAWAIKELAMRLWHYRSRGWAERMWNRWYGWAIRSRLEPIKKVARMIRRHWDGRHQCRHDRPHQRTVRGHQRQDPVDSSSRPADTATGNGSGQRHLLPSGRTRPLSGRARCPHEFLKRPKGKSSGL